VVKNGRPKRRGDKDKRHNRRKKGTLQGMISARDENRAGGTLGSNYGGGGRVNVHHQPESLQEGGGGGVGQESSTLRIDGELPFRMY